MSISYDFNNNKFNALVIASMDQANDFNKELDQSRPDDFNAFYVELFREALGEDRFSEMFDEHSFTLDSYRLYSLIDYLRKSSSSIIDRNNLMAIIKMADQYLDDLTALDQNKNYTRMSVDGYKPPRTTLKIINDHTINRLIWDDSKEHSNPASYVRTFSITRSGGPMQSVQK